MSVLRPRVSRMTGLSAAAAVMAVGLMPAAPALAVTGPEAAAGKYPYAVQLTIGDEANSRACTGSLVNHFWVLTAASCFAGTPGTPVPAGKPALKTTAKLGNGQTLDVTEIVPRDDRDMALVRLATAVIGIKPAALAASAPRHEHRADRGRVRTYEDRMGDRQAPHGHLHGQFVHRHHPGRHGQGHGRHLQG
ncbi:hypothetical protein GCM10020254_05770 [Streptomyces goshikiensis]